MNRWSGILHDVNAFCGCISKIEARNQSGCSIDDKIASACAMFKEDDKTHRNFAYMHCWKVLKDKPKWMERRKHSSSSNRGGKKQKTTADASPSTAALAHVAGNVGGGQPSGTAQERPPGKKKEKQMLRQRASMEAMEYFVAKKKEADGEKDLKKEERCKKAFALQEERIMIERERVEIKRQLEEERIMNIDMSTLNYKQQQYYESRQEGILSKRLNN
ncbi:hypothetical protein PR202_gb12700 [Eleusine coracana subsp. coracana]|uniref:No apical meristem-associated C-terminal domain-containing protein n=1 Tax=Eleusine coracana subsp. coracana TaxID=191504 RepID=A0AAV5ER76_ELECO|nr:hypothetical protein PR202_gb12700 [Eleusine coracana subsp. coracana]